MRSLFCLLLLLGVYLPPKICQAQQNKSQHIWAFGNGAGINFNSGSAVAMTTNITAPEGCSSICDVNGNLLFYTNGKKVWNRDHLVMPNGDNIGTPLSGFETGTQSAVITYMQDSVDKFYIFSLEGNTENGQLYTGRLYYSIVDMKLNGGLGDIVIGQKSLLLDSLLCEKMAVVQGNSCDQWLMVVSLSGIQQFKAFHITGSGINPVPVLSPTAKVNLYKGVIKFSPDRNKMIMCGIGNNTSHALFYHFDPNTGSVIFPFPSLGPVPLDLSGGMTGNPEGNFYGACFSPNNDLVYLAYGGGANGGGIMQYDLSIPGWVGFSNVTIGMPTSDIRLGPDNKIYSCGPSGSAVSTVNFPNISGPFCQYQQNTLEMLPGATPQLGLPADVPNISWVDSSYFTCKDDALLHPYDTLGWGYCWSDGIVGKYRPKAPGTYVVKYITAPCLYHFDTITVDVVQVSSGSAYCDSAWVLPALFDTAIYNYKWYDASLTLIRDTTHVGGDFFMGIAQGDYTVMVSNARGCDTFVAIHIQSPFNASFDADSLICHYEILQLHNTSSGDPQRFQWDFGDGVLSTSYNATHRFSSQGEFEVSLTVSDSLGKCEDTEFKLVVVKQFELGLIPDKLSIDLYDRLTLVSESSTPYSVLGWMPSEIFPVQNLYSQICFPVKTDHYTVYGISEDGCLDTASIVVGLNSLLLIPNAFSPNGDGKNDWFRPVVLGNAGKILQFEIFDRWGKAVFSAYGESAMRGWDGFINGQRAEMSTYYFILTLEKSDKKIVKQRGDLVLVW